MYLANNDDDNNRDIFLSESGQDHTPVPNQETNDADLAIFDRRDVEIDEETAAELAAEAEDAEDGPDEKTRRPAVSRRNWRPLSKSEELTLIARVQRREPRAADELVEQFRPFLLGLLSKTYSNNPLSFDEKLAAGQQGLIRAAEKFEPDKGWRLSTYARHWIKAKINELTAQLCGSVVKSGDREINRGRPGDQSFDAPIGFDEDGDAYTLHDALCDDDDNHDAPDVERHDAMSAAVNAALDDRQRKIFVALNLTDNLPTLDELGRQFEISGERVRQINVAAKEKVSHWLSNSLPESLRKDPDERALTAINIAANAFGSGHCAGGNGKSRSEIHHRIQLAILLNRVVALAERLGRPVTAEDITAGDGMSIVAARECLAALAPAKIGVSRPIVERAKRRNEWPVADIRLRPQKPNPCLSTPRLALIRDSGLPSSQHLKAQPREQSRVSAEPKQKPRVPGIRSWRAPKIYEVRMGVAA